METHTLSWDEIRRDHPDQWVLFEATQSHSVGNKRVIDAIDMIKNFTDGKEAIRQYLKLHREDRQRELYVVHTDKEKLDITERAWVGIRRT